jgi:hypothetical protein
MSFQNSTGISTKGYYVPAHRDALLSHTHNSKLLKTVFPGGFHVHNVRCEEQPQQSASSRRQTSRKQKTVGVAYERNRNLPTNSSTESSFTGQQSFSFMTWTKGLNDEDLTAQAKRRQAELDPFADVAGSYFSQSSLSRSIARGAASRSSRCNVISVDGSALGATTDNNEYRVSIHDRD